MTESTN